MMHNQTVTHYKKTYNGDATEWDRTVIPNVYLSCSDGQTVRADGAVQKGGSVLIVFDDAAAKRISSGDYIVSGECTITGVTGNALKALSDCNPMRVSGRKRYPFASKMAHTTFTLEGEAWT